ncbi:MAG TPA: thiol:disulfide interchange protein DsbG [Nevskiaceae bacterium]|nr:thiol:disulfide interchange protein DsbG [Nevskiaceae bacterium]
MRVKVWMRCAIAGALVAVSGVALAADVSHVQPANLPAMLQTLVKQGKVEVLRQFPTEVPGLTGYVVRHDGQADIVYGSHGAMLVGQLISSKLENLTASYGAKYLPKPDYSAAVKKLDKDGHLIGEGSKKAPLLYAFVDPDCIFCYHLFNATRTSIAADKLQMKWVVLGFLKTSSAGRATAILDASNPLTALRKNYTSFNPGQEEGGMPPSKHEPAAIKHLLKVHFDTMRSLGSGGTPTLLYRQADGKWAMHVGFPSPKWLAAYEQGKPLTE